MNLQQLMSTPCQYQRELSRSVHVLIVLAHPEPKSFNSALANAAREALEAAGHRVKISDLYAQHFSAIAGPADVVQPEWAGLDDEGAFDLARAQSDAAQCGGFSEDIAAEQRKLTWADVLVFQYPMWWFGPPAILKGWADRVLALGVAYDAGRKYDTGLSLGKRALVAVTTGSGAETYTSSGPDGDIAMVLWPMHTILRYCGFDVAEPFVTYAPGAMTVKGRGHVVDEYGRCLVDLCTGNRAALAPVSVVHEGTAPSSAGAAISHQPSA